MGDPVCQGKHLRWFVRAEDTAPNAPNANAVADSRTHDPRLECTSAAGGFVRIASSLLRPDNFQKKEAKIWEVWDAHELPLGKVRVNLKFAYLTTKEDSLGNNRYYALKFRTKVMSSIRWNR